MFALVESGSITKYLNGNKGINRMILNILEQYTLYGLRQKEMLLVSIQ